jgi:Ni,Fe-hydrogenase III large subunit
MSPMALALRNGDVLGLKDLPCLEPAVFHKTLVEELTRGALLPAFFAAPLAQGKRLIAVLAFPWKGELAALSSRAGESFPSLTPLFPQASLFEREVAETWGLSPKGHPWLKPVRFLKTDRPGVMDFYQVLGGEVHEVAVGPVHAGVIEPGHFRFQCHGEKVQHLEIALGYQHRGVEKALASGPDPRTPHLIETLAGDSTVGHATAWCEIMEGLSGHRPNARAYALRAVALELERLANHTGDLGALAGDIAYLPTSSFCGRLRGDILNLTALLCGNRFGRGLCRPGGARWDMDATRAREMLARMKTALRDLSGAVGLLWETPSVLGRFEGAGVLKKEDAAALGVVGPAARASGIERDTRQDFPTGMYRFSQIPLAAWNTGDVFARALVRWLEIKWSAAFITEQLSSLPSGPIQNEQGPLQAEALCVSLVEGWRGRICHVGVTDKQGRFAAYKVVDPSFHNWMGLALAMRGEEISDFPMINKSFNLSYCGHDL